MTDQSTTKTDPKAIAMFIEATSIEWVGTITGAQKVTADLNNAIVKKLMTLYDFENKSLNSYIKKLDTGMRHGGSKAWGKNSMGPKIQALGMKMNVAQKKWDNAINNVQTTAQQETAQMQAQGNDAEQASTAAGLMANLLQTITSLLQSAL